MIEPLRRSELRPGETTNISDAGGGTESGRHPPELLVAVTIVAALEAAWAAVVSRVKPGPVIAWGVFGAILLAPFLLLGAQVWIVRQRRWRPPR